MNFPTVRISLLPIPLRITAVSLKFLPTGLLTAPVFCPIVADYYSGMSVTVPLFAKDINGTKEDIIDNPHSFDFSIEVNPEQLTNALEDAQADLVAINGNYAIGAGLKPSSDALLLEQADQDNPYVNIVACQEGHENDAKIKALVEVLQSEDIVNFIKSQWSDGSVIPATK